MPVEDQFIWRYVPLASYLDMIFTSKLIFRRLDEFKDDPFEGSSLPQDVRLRREVEYSLDQPEEIRKRNIESTSSINEGMRKMFYVSCWHLSEFESDGMWNRYPSESTVCILSSVKSFTTSIKTEHEVYLGKVNYVDFTNPQFEPIYLGNGFLRICRKKNFYEYEREVRAMITYYKDLDGTSTGEASKMFPNNPKFLEIEFDLNELVHEVRVNPRAIAEFKTTVLNVTRKANLNFPVNDSAMRGEPVF